MDLTEPIPAYAPPLSPSPERLLRLAIVVGIAGVIALLVAVIVLVWTVTGVSTPVVSQQAPIPADIESKPVPAAPAAALVPEPAPAPAPAPAAAPVAAPAAAPAASAAGPNSEILQNPAMAAIAPTAPAPVSDSAPTAALPTVTWPSGDVNGLDWNDLNSNLQNAAASYLWQNSGADATTGAIVGAGTAIGTTALNIVGNNAGNLVNTLILANLGYYGGNGLSVPGVGLPGVGLPGPDQVAAALAVPAAVVPQIGVPSVPTSIGIPGTPIGTQIGPPQLPQIGPPQLPSLPGVGIGIPGTPIGIGF
jgi:hypothetical protein